MKLSGPFTVSGPNGLAVLPGASVPPLMATLPTMPETASVQPQTRMQIRVLDHPAFLGAMRCLPAGALGAFTVAIAETEGTVSRLRVEIEGHTCSIGTAEYNLALGDRRANAVKDYLVSRGVTADRLRTVSYGEERPKYDNSREETRRLNRRAALVVNLR